MVNVNVQAVVEFVDIAPVVCDVTSVAEQYHPFFAVYPGVTMNVEGPVGPVHFACPDQGPPSCVVIVAHAPVPDRVAALPDD